MKIISPRGHEYIVGKLLGETEKFNLYLCTYGNEQEAIFKIAKTTKHNGVLDKEAYLLQVLYDEAISVEKEYAAIKTGEEMLNYQFFFPRVVENFISVEQKNRHVNILSFAEIAPRIGQLVPIVLITTRDRVRVDPRTSAWMLGKLLKLLVFTHGNNVLMNLSAPYEDILINREEHYVAVFEWSEARLSSMTLSPEDKSEEISQIAKEIVIVLGGDPDTGEIPEDNQLVDTRYADFLKRLLNKKESDAKKAHTEFYALIRSLWPREFYSYTTHKLL
jgi:hypothetical protein